jgi:hypothetical protein
LKRILLTLCLLLRDPQFAAGVLSAGVPSSSGAPQ